MDWVGQAISTSLYQVLTAKTHTRGLAMVVHTYNSSILEAEAGEAL